MPTYDYRCRYCGPFSRVLSIRDMTAASTCPDCGESATRVFSTPIVIDRTSPLRRAVRAAEKSARKPAVSPREQAVASPESPAGQPGLPG